MHTHALYLFVVSLLSGLMFHNYEAKKDTQTELDFFKSLAIQQQADMDECRQGLAWWRHRSQVIAIERDNARRALETQWLPKIKIVKVKE